jgi:hypothetical protein
MNNTFNHLKAKRILRMFRTSGQKLLTEVVKTNVDFKEEELWFWVLKPQGGEPFQYPMITYSWTVPLILDHSYLVGNLTNTKIPETKDLDL